MAFKTLADMRTKIERDLDIEAEEFIQPEELIELFNDGIARAEARIINLGLRDKYFQKRSWISLVNGQEDYDLPTEIYVDKIEKIIYQKGTIIYKVEPIDSEQMFEEIQMTNTYSAGVQTAYRYLIRHDTPGVEKIQIVPVPSEDLTNGLTVWHFRDANRMSADDDICDLPEIAIQFIYAYVKEKVYEKEKGQAWALAKDDRKEAEELMVETLQQQISDSDLTKLDMDMSAYEEHS